MNKTARLALTAMLALATTFGSAIAASAATESPDVVLDGGDMLTSAQEASLTQAIGRDNAKYDLGIVVETIPALNGRNINQLALSRANYLGVGDSVKDNGVYMLIARDDHEIRIELGSGVSPKIPNATVDQITADDMTPAFRQGDYEGGIEAALTDLGTKYIGDRTSSEQAAHEQQTAADEFDKTMAGVGSVLLLITEIIGAIVGFALLAYTALRVSDYVLEERARKLANRRTLAINDLASELVDRWDRDDLREFSALPNDEARRKWLEPRMTEILVEDPEFAEEFYVKATTMLVNHIFELVEHKLRMRWNGRYKINVRNISLNDALKKFEADSTKEKERQRKEAEVQTIRREEQREASRIAAAKRAEEEAKEKAKATAFWDKLDADQREKVRRARTKRDKERLLTIYGMDSSQFIIWFPLLLTTYPSEIGHPQSEHSSHSSSSNHSSSSSSPSSYSGGSDSSSSFGGGSFDGGGGGGSW